MEQSGRTEITWVKKEMDIILVTHKYHGHDEGGCRAREQRCSFSQSRNLLFREEETFDAKEREQPCKDPGEMYLKILLVLGTKQNETKQKKSHRVKRQERRMEE